MRFWVLFAGLMLIVTQPVLAADMNGADSAEVSNLVSEGAATLGAGDYKSALKLFQEADEAAGGQSWDAAAGAAAAAMQLGKQSQALGWAERMLDIDQTPERRGIARQIMGSCFAGKKKFDEAEDALREALDLLPGRPLQTRVALAGVLCNQRKEMEALFYLDEAALCAQKHATVSEGVTPGRPTRFEVGGPVTEPVKLAGDWPGYPESGSGGRKGGEVVMGTIIGTDGNMECLRVLKGVSLELNCEAALSVINWKFEPSTFEGEPIDVYYVLTFRFSTR
jgi:tetratricopeptide (TPR) repeat protein